MPALPPYLNAFLRRHAELLIFSAFWLLNIIGFLVLPFDRGEQIYHKTNYATMPLGIVLEITTKAVFLYLHLNWLMLRY